MKNVVLTNNIFWNALGKLAKQDIPVKHALALSKSAEKLKKEAERVDKLRQEIIEKFAEIGEDGKPKVSEGGMVSFSDQEKEKECLLKLEELFNLDVDVKLHKLPEAVFEKLNINMSDALLLEDFFDIKEE